MTAANILALGAIVSAFLVFMAALAWAERQTRHLGAEARPAGAKRSVQAARPTRNRG